MSIINQITSYLLFALILAFSVIIHSQKEGCHTFGEAHGLSAQVIQYRCYVQYGGVWINQQAYEDSIKLKLFSGRLNHVR